MKKSIFYVLFTFLMVLMVLPFVGAFNDILTRLVVYFDTYHVIQNVLVPFEVRMVGVMLLPFGYKPMVIGQYLSLNGLKSPLLVEIAWNCIGWQSFIILLLTLLPGLSGNFSPVSKFKAAIVGVLGTFLLNLIRISVVLIIVFHLGSAPALLFHDYAGSFLSILWLFIFWWFSYQYILEEKMTVSSAAKNVSSE